MYPFKGIITLEGMENMRSLDRTVHIAAYRIILPGVSLYIINTGTDLMHGWVCLYWLN